jgi:hypothetical protein
MTDKETTTDSDLVVETDHEETKNLVEEKKAKEFLLKQVDKS